MALSRSRLKKLEKKVQSRRGIVSDKNHLKTIDFNDVDIDLKSLESIQNLVLQTDLRLYLNQAEVGLRYQEAVKHGLIKNIPDEVVKTLATLHKMLDTVAGLSKIKPDENEIKVNVDFGFNLEDLPDFDPESKEVD